MRPKYHTVNPQNNETFEKHPLLPNPGIRLKF